MNGILVLADLLNELARREKDAGIFPEADVDLFMKASAAQGVKSSLVTGYTLKVSLYSPFSNLFKFFKEKKYEF